MIFVIVKLSFLFSYEEGLRAHLSEDLESLKQQQLLFHGNLQQLMDQNMEDNTQQTQLAK